MTHIPDNVDCPDCLASLEGKGLSTLRILQLGLTTLGVLVMAVALYRSIIELQNAKRARELMLAKVLPFTPRAHQASPTVVETSPIPAPLEPA
jgi:hypothetical protein